MAKADLTAARLRELLHYDPDTGVFTWRVRRGVASAGSVAGNTTKDGRVSIYVDNISYRAARLAWLYVYGEWPIKDVGYKNRDCRDTRIDNLMDWANPVDKPKHPKRSLTSEKLIELVDYDPITGLFYRRVRISKTGSAGDIIGSTNSNGRVEVSVAGRIYLAHRIAWLYMKGKWPDNVIDHIDGNPLNNAFSNLRDVTHEGNAQNLRRPGSANKSGYLGVRKKRSRWVASIQVSGVAMHIGTYDTPEAAHAAYLDHKRRLHTTCTI